MQNRTVRLDGQQLSGILTIGGTILGTSREKPTKMIVGGKQLDMTERWLTRITNIIWMCWCAWAAGEHRKAPCT